VILVWHVGPGDMAVGKGGPEGSLCCGELRLVRSFDRKGVADDFLGFRRLRFMGAGSVRALDVI